jgi:putative hemolysin
MTHTSVLIPAREATASSAGSRYSLLLSNDRNDIEAAQKLRYDVFRAEPGFSDSIGADGMDADRFDEFCDHLLVRDERSGQVIGCYRMLTAEGAHAAGGLYTASEFTLAGFERILPNAVEMGRACVHPDHRSGSVLSLMWSGILSYLQVTGNEWVIGCVSVPIQESADAVPGANVRGVRDVMLTSYRAPRPLIAVPRRPVVLDGVPLDRIEPPERVAVPPLLRGYLRLGARICGEPSYDPDFGVADFVAILGLGQANQRYLARLSSAAAAAEAVPGSA